MGLEDYPVDVTTGPLQWKDAEHRLYEDAAQLIADNDQDAALRYRLSQDYSQDWGFTSQRIRST